MDDSAPRVGRRTLLAGAAGVAATALLAGCSAAPATVARLSSGNPFYVAHRGGDRDWPQMTAYAYDQASRLPGLLALEVSTCLSRDGVLVCCHDPNTFASTGVPKLIAATDWSELRTLTVSAAGTLDPGQPGRPLSRIEDVLPHLDRFVLFVEPKTAPALSPLLRIMTRAAQPERVVWKQPIDSDGFAAAKAVGFATWGYTLGIPSQRGERLRRLAASTDIDLLGAPLTGTDAVVAEVVAQGRANGKPTIGWTVLTAPGRDRALRLGCRGLMTADIRGLIDTRSGTPLNP